MSARDSWNKAWKVEADGHPINPLKTGAYVVALILLLAGIYIWKKVY